MAWGRWSMVFVIRQRFRHGHQASCFKISRGCEMSVFWMNCLDAMLVLAAALAAALIPSLSATGPSGASDDDRQHASLNRLCSAWRQCVSCNTG